MKSGIKTTEFWASLAASVLGILTTLGVFTPAQAGELAQGAASIAGAVITAGPIVGYALSRGKAKSAPAARR